MAERRKTIKTIRSFDDFQGGATFMPNPNSKNKEMIPGWRIYFYYDDDGSLWKRPMYLTNTSYSNLCLVLAGQIDGVRTSTLKRLSDERLPEVGFTMTISKMNTKKLP